MRLDPVAILQNYAVVDGALYRRLTDGTMRRITTLNAGRLTTMLDGVRLYGPDIAWVCHHFFACPFPVVAIDMDPHNMAMENLGPVRRRRLIFRATKHGNGLRHPLAPVTFATEEAAKKDWVHRARLFYMADLPLVKTMAPSHADLQAQLSAALTTPGRRNKPSRLTQVRGPRPPKPEVPAGKVCHWYRDQWVILPEPVHPADDWMVRAETVMANPAATFRYDPVLDRVVAA